MDAFISFICISNFIMEQFYNRFLQQKSWEGSERDRRYKNPSLFGSEKDDQDDDGDEMKMMVMVG